MKKNTSMIAALFLALSLIAAACGSSAEELADTATDAANEVLEAADAPADEDDDDDAMEDGDDEDAMADEDDDVDAMEDGVLLDIPATVVDIATSSDDFSILVAALTEAELVETLQGEGPFTVFAPTDEAFEALLTSGNITAEQLLAVEDLDQILTYHVVSGEIFAEDAIAADGTSVETINGASIDIEVVDGSVVINGVATVIATDLAAGNGVVHVIDAILVP